MSRFDDSLREARSALEKGRFRQAFASIVDEAVTRPDDLYAKIALMSDAGIALRDESMIRYGLYLMERHADELSAVRTYAPLHWINVANLQSNLLLLQEASGGERPWYRREMTVPIRKAYRRALDAAGDDEALKVRILTAHAAFLTGMGRDWEAFDLYHQAYRSDSTDIEARKGRTESLMSIAGTAPVLERELLLEVSEQLDRVDEVDQGPGDDDDEVVRDLRLALDLRLRNSGGHGEPAYPRNSVVTDSQREHNLVKFAMDKRLYLSPCSACRRCDQAVGDTVALGAGHAVIREGEHDRFTRMAVLAGRLSERYRSLRIALADWVGDPGEHHGSDQRRTESAIYGWKPRSVAETHVMAAFSGAPVLLEGMASYVALFLGRRAVGPMKGEMVWGTAKAPRKEMVENPNPALHGFWDLLADGLEGERLHADLARILAKGLATDDVEVLMADRELFLTKAVSTLAWFRDLVAYLIRMADREVRGEINPPPLWTLQPFLLPV